MHRPAVLVSLAVVLALLGVAGFASRSLAGPEVRMFRSASCGCCLKWARHLEEAGFRVQVVDTADLAQVKADLGVPRRLAACHTAQVDGYLVEGHVPAREVARLLRERPPVRGLAVPGMPEGSPGMEGPEPEPYAVWAFDASGGVEVFERYPGARAD